MTTHTEQDNQLLDEAANWVIRLRSPELSMAEKQDFSHWLNRSEQHVRAFDDMAATWDTLGAVTHVPELAQQLDHRTDTSPQATANPQATVSTRGWSWNLLSWQSGAALACCAALFAIALRLAPIPTPIDTQIYTTAAGEQKDITLADGSVVSLNTQSTLTVSFTDEQRNLALESGEAYFQVAPNKQRPFVVEVGRGTVTAVGTAFNIYRQQRQTDVVVTEGIVQMREHHSPSNPMPQSERLIANQQASFDQRGLSGISTAHPEQSLAWREQTLVFEQLPLPQALAELNRYLATPVDSTHPSLQQLKVSGTFSLTAPEDTLRALKLSFDLASLPDDPNRLYRPAE